jgi:hypothetical protein
MMATKLGTPEYVLLMRSGVELPFEKGYARVPYSAEGVTFPMATGLWGWVTHCAVLYSSGEIVEVPIDPCYVDDGARVDIDVRVEETQLA